MPKPRMFLLLTTAFTLCVASVFFASAAVQGTGLGTPDALPPLSPDVITIDLPGTAKEMDPVRFSHGLHARAVEGRCDACHVKDHQGISFRFKRKKNDPGTDYKALYHTECLACHAEMKGSPPARPETRAGTGPMEAQCRSCHNADTPRSSALLPLDFDRSLHFRHESTPDIPTSPEHNNTNCYVCHHQGDETTLETAYQAGKESACVYCHTPQGKGKVRNARMAAHDSCVACHVELKESRKAAGPVDCKGCHDAKAQAQIEKMDEIPRLERNQPDTVLMTGWAPLGSDADKNKKAVQAAMNPVAFDHKFHETRDISCKTCHHAALQDCKSCHTVDGKKEGNFVPLADAMHNAQADMSCVGCHTQRVMDKECIGCHAQMPAPQQDQNCAVCHSVNAKARPMADLMDKAATEKLAQDTISMRRTSYAALDPVKIPETVVIDALEKDYKPSVFPHGKVVKALMKGTENSDLAQAFHGSDLTLCMGCHHNSPASETPPQCASCHGKTPDLNTGKPGLKGAYHGQCITCHEKMEIESLPATDCIKCHEKK